MYSVHGRHLAGNQHKQRTNQCKEKGRGVGGGGGRELILLLRISFLYRACSSMKLKNSIAVSTSKRDEQRFGGIVNHRPMKIHPSQ